jgi:peptidase S41-like protein/PDZ domain-containing protein
MHRLVLVVVLSAIGVAGPVAQEALTTKQRDADFVQLASIYAKQYAPYEWKRDVIGFDLYRLTTWLQKVQDVDDLDFQEALIDYVASLNDAHDAIFFPSNFSASLAFTVDIYDGKVLIDSVNRVVLPAAQYPFDVGDELVALDGQPVQAIIASFRKYAVAANALSTDRLAARLLTSRIQQFMPHAPKLADAAVASVRLSASGALNDYSIPWAKTGIGIESQGPLPSPRRGNGRIFLPPGEGSTIEATVGGVGPALFRMADVPPGDNTLPSYMDSIRPLLNVSFTKSRYAVLGFGARTPVFALPANFSQRLGTQSTHFFFSGTYTSNGVRIGFVRIPSMAPPNTTLALQQLDQEMAFFNSNTDVLVVDVTRNPGGTVSATEAFARRLFPSAFRTVGFEIRATALWVQSIVSAVGAAQAAGAPAEVIANLRAIMNEIIAAYNENRGRTAPVSLTTGSLTLQPAPNAYAKPVLLLVDEMTASGGDLFAAVLQDNHRGPLLGTRTMGAGGSVGAFDCTSFTEAFCDITLSLMNRGVVISGTEYPPSPYIENVGVRPDILVDYMTRTNLMTAGAPFVQAFTDAAVKLAQATAVQH